MKKITFFLSALLISMMSFAGEATISFADKAQRTEFSEEKQVWTQNGLIVTNNKAASKNAVGDYANPARFYQGSALTIECTLGNITKIVIDGNSGKPVAGIQQSIGAEATLDGNIVTVIPTAVSNSYSIANFSAQVRVNSITVTYEAGEGGETPDPTPDPEEPETPGVGGDEAPVDGIVIFDANNDHGTASTTAGKYTISKNGVTMGVSKGRLNDAAGGHYRIYKDAKLTITSTVGNIASVEITFIAEGESQYGSAYIAEIEGYTYDGFVGTWTGNSTELVLTTTAQVRVTQIVVTLAEQGDDFVLAPSIAGEVNFLNSTTVTITAEAGLDIYYTLDGTEPTNASTKYTAPFELTETKTVKAIACDGDKASSVVSKTFTKTALIGCAEASALASGKVAYMKPFDVVYVVEGAGYIYIQDETGVALIYDYNLDDQLKAGDHVEGFVGKSSPYNGLPELKPEGVTYDDLTVTPGTAPAPTVVTTVPVAADVNKYVQFNGVSFKDAVSFTSDNATNVTMLMGETEVTVRNSFKLEAELDADTMYNVVGFVAIYNSNIQIYFLSATESNNTGTGLDNITIDTNITKTIVNGQLIIIKDGVKYNAQGQVVK